MVFALAGTCKALNAAIRQPCHGVWAYWWRCRTGHTAPRHDYRSAVMCVYARKFLQDEKKRVVRPAGASLAAYRSVVGPGGRVGLVTRPENLQLVAHARHMKLIAARRGLRLAGFDLARDLFEAQDAYEAAVAATRYEHEDATKEHADWEQAFRDVVPSAGSARLPFSAASPRSRRHWFVQGGACGGGGACGHTRMSSARVRRAYDEGDIGDDWVVWLDPRHKRTVGELRAGSPGHPFGERNACRFLLDQAIALAGEERQRREAEARRRFEARRRGLAAAVAALGQAKDAAVRRLRRHEAICRDSERIAGRKGAEKEQARSG